MALPLTSGRTGAMGHGVPDVLQSTTSSSSFSPVVQVGTLPQLLDQWKSITSNRCVLSMVKGLHLQLRFHPLLFHNIKQLPLRLLQLIIPFFREGGGIISQGCH